MFHIKNPSVIYVAYSHIGRNSIKKYGFVNNLHKFQYFIKLLLGNYSQFNYNAYSLTLKKLAHGGLLYP